MKKTEQDLQKEVSKREEEVDLGYVLILFGKFVSSIFSYIGKTLQFIFGALLDLILFIRSHFRKLVIAAIIGGVIGFSYQHFIKEKEFESAMTVQPNFGSAVQLYKNIAFYESLIEQEDYPRLMQHLEISEEEAKSLTGIEVEPYSNENQILLSYKNFTESLDSLTINLIEYEDYSKAQPEESFKYHIVKVTSTDKFIFEKLEGPIIHSIVENTYYDKVKTTSYSNLISKKVVLERTMQELDSLRNLYKQVLLLEGAREGSGTNIYMAEPGDQNKEVLVIDKYVEVNEELIIVNEQLTEVMEVVNVVSNFNSVGMKVKGWNKNFAFLGASFGFLLLFAFLGMRKINEALVSIETRKKQE